MYLTSKRQPRHWNFISCDSKPFWRCLGTYLDCIRCECGLLVCIGHLVYHLKAMLQNTGTVESLGYMYLHPTILLIWKHWSTALHVEWWGRKGKFLWQCFSCTLKEIFVSHSLIYSLIFFLINAALEFWMSLVVCTQMTAKRLSLLVTCKLRPDLLLNDLGKAQNMRER